jgi:hypothetical protein
MISKSGIKLGDSGEGEVEEEAPKPPRPDKYKIVKEIKGAMLESAKNLQLGLEVRARVCICVCVSSIRVRVRVGI